MGVWRIAVGRLGGARICPKTLGGVGYIQKGCGGLSQCVRVTVKVMGQWWASREGASKGGHVWGGLWHVKDAWGMLRTHGAC